MAITREEVDKVLFQVRTVESALVAENNAVELNRFITHLLGIACSAQKDYTYMIEHSENDSGN